MMDQTELDVIVFVSLTSTSGFFFYAVLMCIRIYRSVGMILPREIYQEIILIVI